MAARKGETGKGETGKADKIAARRSREAAALRENLRRRKAQSRARAAQEPDSRDCDEDPDENP